MSVLFYIKQPIAKWFNKPHKEPSGVWTGHIKPQQSGSNFLTDVVFISTKYAPLCILLKWDQNLILLSLSAIIEKPLLYIKSKPVLDFMLPVDNKVSIFDPTLQFN